MGVWTCEESPAPITVVSDQYSQSMNWLKNSRSESQVWPSESRSASVTRAEVMTRKPASTIPTRTKNALSSPPVSRFTWNAARRKIGMEKNVVKRVGISGMARGSSHPMRRPGHDSPGPFDPGREGWSGPAVRRVHQLRPGLGQDVVPVLGEHEAGRDGRVRGPCV